MKKYFLMVAFAALILGGCTLPNQQQQQPEQPTAPVTPVEPEKPQTEVPPPPETVPQPPKEQTINWNASVQPMVAKMLQADGVQAGSVLLLDSVKNSTNGSLPVGNATAALHDALATNNKFQVVPDTQLASAKQALGLSVDDSLGSRSKAIGLARYVNAQYVLYSTVTGDVKSPTVKMQMMTVPSGEIVWSGNGAVQH
ncbi:penicillin-binding protein activator [Ewingella americana]